MNELSEEIESYKELTDSQHTDKIHRLIDDLTNDLQKNTRQILYDQLIRVKNETSHLLNESKCVEHQDSTVQTSLSGEKALSSTITTDNIEPAQPPPPTKRSRKSST